MLKKHFDIKVLYEPSPEELLRKEKAQKKIKFKEREVHWVLPPFGHYEVWVVLTTDMEKSFRKRPETRDARHDEDTEGMCACIEREAKSIIVLRYNPRVGSVAHEVTHAVQHIAEYLGIGKDAETVAYLVGYFTQGILDFAMKGK